jgi:hypothetical protein
VLAKPLEAHLAALVTLRDVLEASGFDTQAHVGKIFVMPEVPLPALCAKGSFLGVDLATQTASFPHGLLRPIHDAYCALHRNLRRERSAAVGRPIVSTWDDIALPARTSIRTILAPMRSGVYGEPRGILTSAYHCAEFAYLVSKVDSEAVLMIDDEAGSWYTELDGATYGVVNGQYTDEKGEFHTCKVPFEPAKLQQLRPLPGAMMSPAHRLWSNVHRFLVSNGLAENLELMQLFAHCRWATPTSFTWALIDKERRQPGRPVLPVRTAQAKARLRAACLQLQEMPNASVRSIKAMLVPSVIGLDQWRKEITPMFVRRRNLRPGRQRLLAYLQSLYEQHPEAEM